MSLKVTNSNENWKNVWLKVTNSHEKKEWLEVNTNHENKKKICHYKLEIVMKTK